MPLFKAETLTEVLRYRAACHGERRACIFLTDGVSEQSHLTYAKLDSDARAIGAVLQRCYASGERALLLYPPGLEFVTAFLGCLYGGVIAVPVCPPGRSHRTMVRLAAIAEDARPSVVLTSAALLQSLRGLLRESHLDAIEWLATDRLADREGGRWRAPAGGAEAAALLQYTSGSTGSPKGVIISHRNLLANSEMMRVALGHDERSTHVSWLPVYHDMGLIGHLLQSLYVGASCVLMSPLAFLKRPVRWLGAISRYQAQTSGAPDFAYDLCVSRVTASEKADLDLRSWKIAQNGAEPIRPQTLERFTEAFRPCGFRSDAFYPCYGLAEATVFVSGGSNGGLPVVTSADRHALGHDHVVQASSEDAGSRRLVGCGRPWLEEELVIVDPQSETRCPLDRVGEIWVSGPNIAQGYWNRPGTTQQVYGAHLADTGEGPFLRTGDLGFVKDGELFITGRLKDLIIIDGCNHFPQDIELTLERSHPSLRPHCSAAIQTDVGDGERLVLVAEMDTDLLSSDPVVRNVDEVVRVIRRAVALEHELRVHAVSLIRPGTIPKTSSGKVQRHACRERFLSRTLKVVVAPQVEGNE